MRKRQAQPQQAQQGCHGLITLFAEVGSINGINFDARNWNVNLALYLDITDYLVYSIINNTCEQFKNYQSRAF